MEHGMTSDRGKGRPREQRASREKARQQEAQHEEERIDQGVEDTFPASDPTAVGGATRIERGGKSEAGADGGASEDGGGSDDTPSAPPSAPSRQP
jgi:hypothetical protein